ncbi:putative transcription factor C2H2 family [Helianthus annuus]|nr:putative transcription factor C2H2 family [Helianthus annuus]
MDLYIVSSPRKLVQCRICHDDDQDSSMEMPCGCRGSLKYAHRKCVQRWCNEKGNTTCEICLQPFKPGYTSPPQLFHYGSVPMNFRGNWEISRISSMGDTSYDSLEFDFDEYTAPSSTSLLCCRIVSIFFITLLVLRYTLPIIIKLTGAYSSTVLMLNLLMVIGILLPICIMARAFTAAQHLHRHQQPDLSQTESQPNLIHVH